MTQASALPCPRCGAPAARRPANRASPFCSERCRLLDLGAWLDEDHRIPGPPAGSEPEGQGPAARLRGGASGE